MLPIQDLNLENKVGNIPPKKQRKCEKLENFIKRVFDIKLTIEFLIRTSKNLIEVVLYYSLPKKYKRKF